MLMQESSRALVYNTAYGAWAVAAVLHSLRTVSCSCRLLCTSGRPGRLLLHLDSGAYDSRTSRRTELDASTPRAARTARCPARGSPDRERRRTAWSRVLRESDRSHLAPGSRAVTGLPGRGADRKFGSARADINIHAAPANQAERRGAGMFGTEARSAQAVAPGGGAPCSSIGGRSAPLCWDTRRTAIPCGRFGLHVLRISAFCLLYFFFPSCLDHRSFWHTTSRSRGRLWLHRDATHTRGLALLPVEFVRFALARTPFLHQRLFLPCVCRRCQGYPDIQDTPLCAREVTLQRSKQDPWDPWQMKTQNESQLDMGAPAASDGPRPNKPGGCSGRTTHVVW